MVNLNILKNIRNLFSFLGKRYPYHEEQESIRVSVFFHAMDLTWDLKEYLNMFEYCEDEKKKHKYADKIMELVHDLQEDVVMIVTGTNLDTLLNEQEAKRAFGILSKKEKPNYLEFMQEKRRW